MMLNRLRCRVGLDVKGGFDASRLAESEILTLYSLQGAVQGE